jgi:hypothetical protein
MKQVTPQGLLSHVSSVRITTIWITTRVTWERSKDASHTITNSLALNVRTKISQRESETVNLPFVLIEQILWRIAPVLTQMKGLKGLFRVLCVVIPPIPFCSIYPLRPVPGFIKSIFVWSMILKRLFRIRHFIAINVNLIIMRIRRLSQMFAKRGHTSRFLIV